MLLWAAHASVHRGATGASASRAREEGWWVLRGSNPQPTDYESAALTIELRTRVLAMCLREDVASCFVSCKLLFYNRKSGSGLN